MINTEMVVAKKKLPCIIKKQRNDKKEGKG